MNLRLSAAETWAPDGPAVRVIDAHTGGEPLRIIVSGYPVPQGRTILERRRDLIDNHDRLRTALMWEPRGHADMYGCLITPPVSDDADFGVLFMHNEGYSTMCGHGIIAVTTVVLETGMLPRAAPMARLIIDSPAGKITAYARMSRGKVDSVRFENVPSFALALDQEIAVPGYGIVPYDIAYGGAFYAYVEASKVGLTCTPDHYRELIEAGQAIKEAIMTSVNIAHPFETDLGFLYGTIFIGPAESSAAHSRNVCVFAEGEVDRCPTGTGVSGRAAIHMARGEIDLNEPLRIESIIGSSFTVRVLRRCKCGPHQAIIPEVEGRAFMTGRSSFHLDSRDPLCHGFLLR
ncbi:MAG: proline racemase family protein [Bacteroidota bacterium]|nr:proline racemase family protein [Bacteroidota bacterium]